MESAGLAEAVRKIQIRIMAAGRKDARRSGCAAMPALLIP